MGKGVQEEAHAESVECAWLWDGGTEVKVIRAAIAVWELVMSLCNR